MLATIQITSFSLHVFYLRDVRTKIGLHIVIVVLHRCKIVSVILMEEHILKMLENRVLKKLYGPTGQEVPGDWKNQHNEELYSCTSVMLL
jgi:hypothetical protein